MQMDASSIEWDYRKKNDRMQYQIIDLLQIFFRRISFPREQTNFLLKEKCSGYRQGY
jgi:hypothetical protein